MNHSLYLRPRPHTLSSRTGRICSADRETRPNRGNSRSRPFSGRRTASNQLTNSPLLSRAGNEQTLGNGEKKDLMISLFWRESPMNKGLSRVSRAVFGRMTRSHRKTRRLIQLGIAAGRERAHHGRMREDGALRLIRLRGGGAGESRRILLALGGRGFSSRLRTAGVPTRDARHRLPLDGSAA